MGHRIVQGSRIREDGRIDEDDVNHGEEGRQASNQFLGHSSTIFLEFEKVVHTFSLSLDC